MNPNIVVFDIGGVLIDWNPAYLYRKLLPDEVAVSAFLSGVCTTAWNEQFDAGRPFAEGIADLAARHPEQTDLIEAYWLRWHEMLGGEIAGTAELLSRLKAAGIGIAIVSSNAEDGIRAALGEAAASVDIFECGAALFGKDQHFKKAVRYSGLDPTRFLAIGDEARDIEAARKAGIAAGAVAWGYADPVFLQKLGPDRFFTRMEEIAPAFGVV